ncbi:ABC transporter ATP-binding protein [Streptomyces sp. NPDC000229]|uniref:ABC transporter ATP-binding protein n=1 Tax=Streptomyces sp. NPDC000229 TaxID=3154247 RepID=UPI003324A7CE
MPENERRGPVLAAEEIVAGYLPGVDVLRGCSIEVRPGELVGVIGPNGAGKSTLAKALFGLLRVRGGTVHLHGDEVTNRPAHELVHRGVGYVPQLQNVFPELTVEENLRMGMYLRPGGYTDRVAVVEELFPVLAARRRQKAGSMSGGERQMLAMARALMMEPHVLLLDEPSAGLSPRYQDQVFDRVKEINGAGVAVLMVEQNARRCLQICDRGYVLDQGRNAYTGAGLDLLHDEKVIELYLGTLARVR